MWAIIIIISLFRFLAIGPYINQFHKTCSNNNKLAWIQACTFQHIFKYIVLQHYEYISVFFWTSSQFYLLTHKDNISKLQLYLPTRCELNSIELLIPGKLVWRGCQIQRLPPSCRSALITKQKHQIWIKFGKHRTCRQTHEEYLNTFYDTSNKNCIFKVEST